MAEEKEDYSEILPEIPEMEEILEKEEDYLKKLEKRIAKEISIHHRDLHSVLKDALKKTKDVMKKAEQINEEDDKGKALEEYEEIFEDNKEIDKDFEISMLTTIAILRYIAHYYLLRKKFSQRFEELGNELGEKTNKIIKRDKAAVSKIDELVKSIAKATHSHTPAGALINAAKSLEEILDAEGVKSWVTRRLAGSKKTAAKKEKIE